MVIQPAGDTVMPRLVAWWREIRTNVFESVKRRSDNTSPVLRPRKTDCERERLVLLDAPRPPPDRPRPRDEERPRCPSPRRSRAAGRPRPSSPLRPAVSVAQGVAATGPALPAAPVLDCPAEAMAATAAVRDTARANCRSGAQSAGASSGQAAAAMVRVASVGSGVVRVSWLARTVIDAFFFSPPDFDRPGACPRRARSTHRWRALPPPRPVDDISSGRRPIRSQACLQEAAGEKAFVKISLHCPDVG